MQLGNISIRNDSIILKDVDGSEVSLSAEDILTIRAWIYDQYLDILALVYPHERMFSDRHRTTEALRSQEEEREQLL